MGSSSTRLQALLIRRRCQSLLYQFSRAGFAGEDEVQPLGTDVGETYRFAGERFRAAGVGVPKENAVHRMGCGDAILRVLAGCGHEHRVAAAVDANLDGINVELRHEFLKIGENAGG